MRIIINLTLTVVVSVMALRATAQAGFGIGVNGGLLLASQTYSGGNFNDDVSNITGFTVGIPVEVVLLGPLAFQAELNYQRRGAKVERKTTNATNPFRITQERKLNYVELPVLLKLGITGEKFVAAVLAGPSFGYAVSGTETIRETAGTIVRRDEDGKLNFDNFKRGDLNGIVGAQAGIPFGGGKLVADARYRFGLNNLRDGDNSNAPDEIKSKGFSLTAGYMITFGNY